MAVWEMLAPRRVRKLARGTRWPSNIGVVVLDTILVRLAFPITAVGLALVAEARGWGLMQAVGLPAWAGVPLAVVALDLAIYLQHVLFHAVPALWRLHRMHHADLEIDVSTGARFHPIEILLSMGLKLGVIAALGTPAVAVLAFEVLLNATSMFNHSNVRMPLWLDRVLRWIVVTPDMHRVHHSAVARETNSNFGFNLPWWDRLFGTYRDQPAAGHEAMTIGVEQFRNPAEQRLDRMLTQPFRDADTGYALGRRERLQSRFVPSFRAQPSTWPSLPARRSVEELRYEEAEALTVPLVQLDYNASTPIDPAVAVLVTQPREGFRPP
jgi:sterol desaturase/sphingolipid hydroxylase (fatty acid hydroxylase superfamily)